MAEFGHELHKRTKMKVKFCGAAKTVTGSCHLITLDNGYKILLDCGLYQGYHSSMRNFNREWLFDPKDIDVMILSHAHIDHSGRIPKLVKDGFKGDIICTNATRDLAAIMLLDSAFIQEKDAVWANKKRKKKGEEKIEPLYQVPDARKCLSQFIGIGYDRWFYINDKVSFILRDSGHILGSASVTLKIKEGNTEKTIGFTGDIGRPERPILKDPVPIDPVDFLICESTYAGKTHSSAPQDEEDLLKVIKETCVVKKGKLLIPAFSVGRTQEIVYMLDRLESSGKLPKIPVYVDSPLAINATEIFIMHPECYDDEILKYMIKDRNPFGFNSLHYTRKVEESKKLNKSKKPAIIISASGMMQAGRIKHHIFNNIDKKSTTLLIVGYCSPNTLGGRLRQKPKTIKIFGEEKMVKADIKILDSFSAHGDQGEMIEYLNKQHKKKLKKIFLVHGEQKRQQIFQEALLKKGFKKVEIPNLGQKYKI